MSEMCYPVPLTFCKQHMVLHFLYFNFNQTHVVYYVNFMPLNGSLYFVEFSFTRRLLGQHKTAYTIWLAITHVNTKSGGFKYVNFGFYLSNLAVLFVYGSSLPVGYSGNIKHPLHSLYLTLSHGHPKHCSFIMIILLSIALKLDC